MSEPRKFQYRTVMISPHGTIDLDWYGDSGWELVGVTRDMMSMAGGLKYIFKRPVSQGNKVPA